MAKTPDKGKAESQAEIAQVLVGRGYAKHLRTPGPRVRVSIKLRVNTIEGGHYYVLPDTTIRIGATFDASTPVRGDERLRMLAEDVA